MLMRVAIGIHGEDIQSVLETYDLMSDRYFTHASPTLFNAGTRRYGLIISYSDTLHLDPNYLHASY